MENIETLKNENTALKQQSEIFKTVIENMKVEKQALEKISYNANQEIYRLTAQSIFYQNYIEKKEAEIKDLTAKVEKLTKELEEKNSSVDLESIAA